MSNFRFGRRSKAKLYGDSTHPGVHPKVAELCVKALGYSEVDFGIIDGVRLTMEQQQMFANKRSMLDGVNKISDHQIGLAIDVLPTVHDEHGNRLDPYDISDNRVKVAWLEVYRAFMRASMKLGLVIEFGLGYNIHGGHDWPHMSVKNLSPETVPYEG